MVAKVPGAGEQAAMPEGIDGWRRRVEAPRGARVADIFETKSHAEETDRSAREARDDGKGKPLLQGVGGGHSIQFTCASACRVMEEIRVISRKNIAPFTINLLRT